MNTRIRPPPIKTPKNITPIRKPETPKNITPIRKPDTRPITPKNITPIRKPDTRPITPKNITPIVKPETPKVKHRPITPKYVKPYTPKHVVSPIHLYVISDAGKLIQPHSPLGPPPPLKNKPGFKRPVCKNPNK